MTYVAVFSESWPLLRRMHRLTIDAFVNSALCYKPDRCLWTDAMIAVTDMPTAVLMLRANFRPRRDRHDSSTILVVSLRHPDLPPEPWLIADALGCSHVVDVSLAPEDWFISHFRAVAQLS